ncbi:3-dehydroquinate synthase [Opitutaceae bacterium TAV5]|nr:3-dehydroquinate synthase [Opitutaceae bacterium TAV5]
MSDSLLIQLGERSYPITFGADLRFQVRSALAALRAEGRRYAVVTDRHIDRQQAEALQAMTGDAPVRVLEPGEQTKSLAELGNVLDFLAENRLDRSSVLVAVGGGVIGDLAGFAAASYLRGIGFYQIPTTLLAMVDSSVGGKTGINLRAGKNLVGAFHQPKAVFISTDLLSTLPPREFAAGMAEVIKYGLLGDRELFEELEATPLLPGAPRLADVIRRCCAIKAAIVEADERETAKDGGRALLNLGHTFGHAIEQVTGYGAYLHGEAVAIGLCAAARLSRHLGYLDDAAVARVEKVVDAHALPVRLREPLPVDALAAAMARDKKVRAGALRFVVLRALGTAATQGDIDPVLAGTSFVEVGAALAS